MPATSLLLLLSINTHLPSLPLNPTNTPSQDPTSDIITAPTTRISSIVCTQKLDSTRMLWSSSDPQSEYAQSQASHQSISQSDLERQYSSARSNGRTSRTDRIHNRWSEWRSSRQAKSYQRKLDKAEQKSIRESRKFQPPTNAFTGDTDQPPEPTGYGTWLAATVGGAATAAAIYRTLYPQSTYNPSITAALILTGVTGLSAAAGIAVKSKWRERGWREGCEEASKWDKKEKKEFLKGVR